MTNIPEEFVVGGMHMKVTFEKSLFHNLNRFSLGFHNSGEIRLAEESTPIQAKQHLMMQLYVYGSEIVRGSKARDQAKVESRLVFALLRDNPDLMDTANPIWDLTIRFLGKNYRVLKRSPALDFLATLQNAFLFIDVSEYAAIDVQRMSLFHELLHAIRLHLGYDLRDADSDDEDGTEEEERIVDGMAWMLMALLTQNEMSWLKETADEMIDTSSIVVTSET